MSGKQDLEVLCDLEPPYRNDSGFAWSVRLPAALHDLTDTNSSRRSPFVLFEDAKELGPAHTLHKDIRESGAGRYSFKEKWIWFAASDNSDPNKNGRRYSVRKSGSQLAAAAPTLVPNLKSPISSQAGPADDLTRLAEWISSRIASYRNTFSNEQLGLDPFFLRKSERDKVFHPYEVAVISDIEANFPKSTRVIEVGCGIGSMCFALAQRGYSVLGLEASSGLMKCLQLLQSEGSTPGLEFRYGFFPTSISFQDLWDRDDVLLVSTNLGGSYIRERENRYVNLVRLFGKFILDLGHFGAIRLERSERQKLLTKLEETGCRSERTIFESDIYDLRMFTSAPR